MDRISATARQTLADHSFPAVKLSELVELVGEVVDRSLDGRRLRGLLERYPETFTILDPMRGPWRSLVPSEQFAFRDTDPWVLGREGPARLAGEERSAAVMRSCVRWLARHVDGESSTQVSRLFSILLSERETRSTLRRPGAAAR